MAKVSFVFRPFSTYDNIVDKLNTGDIVLFSGDTASGDIIKVATKSEFSHVAIILDDAGSLVTLEATTNLANLVDLLTNKTGPGVRSFPLREKIFAGTYNTIAIRQANFNISDLQKAALKEFGDSLKGASYDSNPEDLIQPACNDYGTQVSSLIPLCNTQAGDNTYEDMGSFFCSEFVAKALINMSLLSSTKFPALYTPIDFASTAPVPLDLLTTGGYSLETYIFINLPTSNPLLGFLVGVWYFVFGVSILTVIAGLGYIILALVRGAFSSPKEMPDPIEDVKSNTDTPSDSKKESMRESKSDSKSNSKIDTKSDVKRDSLASSELPKSKLKSVTKDVELGYMPAARRNTEPPASVPNFSTPNSFSTNKSSKPPMSVQL